MYEEALADKLIRLKCMEEMTRGRHTLSNTDPDAD